ncbi:MAG: argininosuccinate lyase [Phycisphaeraceae bacterium]
MSGSHKPWEHAKHAGSETDPLAARFVASLDYDKRLYKHDIRGSKAHAAMLEKVGLITADDLSAITAGLDEIEKEIDEQGDAWPGWKVELEDVHMCVEAALIEKAGDAGRKLHTGRSRNDQVALDLRLWASAATNSLLPKFKSLYAAFVTLSEKYGMVVMPSYTHLQRAQPIVVGGELLAWVTAFERCERRLTEGLYSEKDINPLGSGAIAGSSLPLDRSHTTYEFMALSLAGDSSEQDDGDDDTDDIDLDALEDIITPHISLSSIDATASRDTALDFAYALTMTSMWLSRWAEQWIIYATTEFGFITLADTYTTGSSMMPQKQNPDMLELIRGKTGQVYGSLVALLTMCKGLTVGYNRDLQEDKRHLFAAYDAVCDCLDMAAGIVRTTRFNEANIKRGLDKGYLDATSLAEYLVTKGVPFRTAHQVVGRLVGLCEERQLGVLKKLHVSEFNTVCREYNAGEVVEHDVFDWLGPENVVKRYRSAGNAGVSGFEAQLKAWKERLDR